MPTFAARKPDEVPTPNRSSRATQQLQSLYESFIQQVKGHVGELHMDPGESARGAKVRLRRAATRLGSNIEVWEASGKVYFRLAEKKSRRQVRGA